MSMLSIGTTALIANQGALATTSHNISNVNTEGYSRQRAEFGTHPPEFQGTHYLGTGVEITSVERMFDQFLSTQVRQYTSQEQQSAVFNEVSTRVDELLALPELSISVGLDDFFNAVQDVADDPTSLAARQVMLSQADILTKRFHTMDQQIGGLSSQVNSGLEISVQDVNVLSKGIATLNQSIFDASFGNTIPPNDLLDQRDQLINDLSKLVSVSTLKQDDGAINVFIGNGQALVVGNAAIELSTVPNPTDTTKLEIAYGPSQTIISNQITGGSLGGLISVRSSVLATTQQELDTLAASFVESINAQHKVGITLDGNAGGDFFTVPTPPTTINANNISLAITNPRDIAAAFPVTNTTSVSNTGTGQLETIAIDGSAPLFDPINTLTTDISFSYDSVTGVYNVTYDGGTATIVYDPATDSGKTYDLSALAAPPHTDFTNGKPPLTITLSGVPANTDSFTITNSVVGGIFTAVGDNRNALALAELQTSKTMDPNGTGTNTQSFGQSYEILVADVATKTHASEIGQQVQQGLLDQANLRYESVSGVNLDEEAANLIRYQQAYQAAAQIITVSNTVFNSLLNAF